jgi:hypothetical protein
MDCGSGECAALSAKYEGLKFNSLSVYSHDRMCAEHPESELISVYISVSGSSEALVRHGFARTEWFLLPPCGIRHIAKGTCRTGDRVIVTVTKGKADYRIVGTHPDWITPIAAALAPLVWMPVASGR